LISGCCAISIGKDVSNNGVNIGRGAICCPGKSDRGINGPTSLTEQVNFISTDSKIRNLV
jgi:hypothetical protein